MGNDADKDDAGHLIRMSRSGNILVPEKVPLKYSQGTPLTFTVPRGGTDSANFDLTGDPPPTPNTKGEPPKGLVVPQGTSRRDRR